MDLALNTLSAFSSPALPETRQALDEYSYPRYAATTKRLPDGLSTELGTSAGCRCLRTRPRTLRLRNLCMLRFFSQVNCFQPRTKTPDDRMTLQMLKLQLALITKQLETRALVADLVH
jgi:hypothetical protein